MYEFGMLEESLSVLQYAGKSHRPSRAESVQKRTLSCNETAPSSTLLLKNMKVKGVW